LVVGGSLAIGLACTTDGTAVRLCDDATVTPASAPLVVAGEIRLAAFFDATATCTPPVPATALRGSTRDSTIAQVDSVSGVVLGVAPGIVNIVVQVPAAQQEVGSARVMVFAPLHDRIITTRFRFACPTPSCEPWSFHGPPGIWTVAPDGTDLRLIRGSLHYPDHARVSPDGATIVFEEWGNLYVMDGAGHTVRRLETGLAANFAPSWSPDGHWITFVGFEPATSRYQVFVIRPDGTELRQLTDDPFGARAPAWSPDGSMIAFVRDSTWSDGRAGGAAFVIDTSGGNIRALSTGILGFHGQDPEWSPDGAAIVFTSRPFLTRLQLATGQYDTLTYHDDNRPASWSPDGARIIVGTGEIFALDPGLRYPNNPVIVLLGLDSLFNMAPFYTPARR
jgi:Tol biopolymer transport system component